LIEESEIYFDYILHREQCTYSPKSQAFIKDLRLLSIDRDMRDVVLVDNKVKSYSLHLENGVPIKDFIGDPEDCVLEDLCKYLIKLRDADDVRSCIRNDFINNR
jgi:TFIIF-interacting CTD phosphatase-like protein